MSNTSNLQLPYLAVGQAQKHVTVNETLRMLDAIVQLGVVSATTTTEPVSPADGDVYIVPAGKSGTSWVAFANWALGYYRDGAWVEIAPREGWLAFVRDSDQLLAYTGSAWSLFAPGKILTVSATDKVLGRATSGAGAAEEIACTAAGRALIDDADAAAQRTTLGLGTAAVKNTGTSGSAVPLLNGANAWSDRHTFTAPNSFYGMVQFIAGATNAEASIGFRDASDADSASWVIGKNLGGLSDDSFAWYYGGIRMTLSTSGVLTAGGSILPAADNASNLGSASLRFGTVYAATGAINTSDACEKTSLRSLNGAEARAVRRIVSGIGMFQWLAAVSDKGVEAARLHAGVTAQAVAEAFRAEGLDPERYALWCADSWTDADGETHTRAGVRYDQLFAMALATLAA